VHGFCRNILVETPFFQFGFPLTLAMNKHVSFVIKGFAEPVPSPGCESLLLFNDVHSAREGVILHHVEPTDVLFDRVPF
jgi:hypothetical protein